MNTLNATEVIRPVKPQALTPEKRLRKMVEVLTDKWGDRKDSLLDYKAEALLITGKEKHHHYEIRTLYIGALSNCDFILNKVYDLYDVVKKENSNIWGIRSHLRILGQLADLIVMDIPWPYQFLLPRNQFIESPAWVCQRTAISLEWSEVERKFSKEARTEDFRKIRKYGLSYETTTDPKDIETFYDQMYCPYLTNRFGDLASIEPRWKIRHFAQKGKLLQIKRDGHVIAAAVLYEWKKCMHFLWTGTREEPGTPLGRGAFSALYYYSMLHAFESSCDSIDFEGTRPFLNDGIFLFKRKWGSYVCDGWSLDTFLFQPKNFGPAVISFFANNPLVIRGENGLAGKILFHNEGKACTPVDLEGLVKRYGGSGLKHLGVASTSGYDPDAWEYARSSPQNMHLVDLSKLEKPAQQIFTTK
jgi:hypothetical protein